MAPLWKLFTKEDVQIERVRHALRDGANINSASEDGETALMLAVLGKQNAIAKFLLEQSALEVNKRDKLGRTALYLATRENNIEAMQLLLANQQVVRPCLH